MPQMAPILWHILLLSSIWMLYSTTCTLYFKSGVSLNSDITMSKKSKSSIWPW